MRVVEALWTDAYRQRAAVLQSGEAGQTRHMPPQQLSISVRCLRTDEAARRAVNAALMEYSDAHHGPTVVLLQSPLGVERMVAGMYVLGRTAEEGDM